MPCSRRWAIGRPAVPARFRPDLRRLHAVVPVEEVLRGSGGKPVLQVLFELQAIARRAVPRVAQPLRGLLEHPPEAPQVAETDELDELPAAQGVRAPQPRASPVEVAFVHPEELLDPLPPPVVAEGLERVHRLVGGEREVAEVAAGGAHGVVPVGHLRRAATAGARDGHVAVGEPLGGRSQVFSPLEEGLHLVQAPVERILLLRPQVGGPEDVHVQPPRERLLPAVRPSAPCPPPRPGQDVPFAELRRAAHAGVEGAHAVRAVERVLQFVDGLAHPRFVRVHEGEELAVACRELRHVRLAAEAVVGHDQRLGKPEALQLDQGVGDGHHVGDVPRLLREGDRLAVRDRVQGQQLDRLEAVAVLVEPAPGLVEVLRVRRDGRRVVGDRRFRVETGRAQAEVALDAVLVGTHGLEEPAGHVAADGAGIGRGVHRLPGGEARKGLPAGREPVARHGENLLRRPAVREGRADVRVDAGHPPDMLENVRQARVMTGRGRRRGILRGGR